MACVALAFVVQINAVAESRTAFQVYNRLRLEYDDNIYEREEDEQDSIKIIEEVEIVFNLNMENTVLNFRYKPYFIYWDDRDEDSTDLHHELDLSLSHAFTPRLSLSAKNSFRIAQLPEVTDEVGTFRQRSDFVYNSARGALMYQVAPMGRVDLSGRYTIIRYDEDEVAARNDYDTYAGGLTYHHRVVPETSVSGAVRFENIDYSENTTFDRGSDTIFAGLGVEHLFSPSMVGSASAGYSRREYNDDDLSSETQPYFDASMVVMASPSTRFSVGAGYSLLQADIFPFASQNNLRLYAGVAHDVTQRVTLNLLGAYSRSDYEATSAIPRALADAGLTADDLEDGTEQAVTLSARASYQIARSHWLDASWNFTTFDSDLRQDFDRNRVSLGWRAKLF